MIDLTPDKLKEVFGEKADAWQWADEWNSLSITEKNKRLWEARKLEEKDPTMFIRKSEYDGMKAEIKKLKAQIKLERELD